MSKHKKQWFSPNVRPTRPDLEVVAELDDGQRLVVEWDDNIGWSSWDRDTKSWRSNDDHIIRWRFLTNKERKEFDHESI